MILETGKVERHMEWLWANKEWIFSGIGVSLIFYVFNPLKKYSPLRDTGKSPIIINNGNNIGWSSQNYIGNTAEIAIGKKSLEAYKNEMHILFIDDDVRFKVAKILVKSGWVHTKLVKDAVTLDDSDIVRAHILFIDVQGVGVSLGFSDEGLGLALAIKEKYPQKKVIIYSAETKGDRFHAALRRADSFLPKNADPYEFQKIVEDFTIGAKEF